MGSYTLWITLQWLIPQSNTIKMLHLMALKPQYGRPPMEKSVCQGGFWSRSVVVRLAVSGEQLLFTLRLPMFALSLEYFMSLQWGPCTNIDLFIYVKKYHLKDTNKIFKKCHVGPKLERGLLDILVVSWKRPSFEVFFVCSFDVLLAVTYTNIPVTTQWPLKR